MKKLLAILTVLTVCLSAHAQENDDRGYIVKVADKAPAFQFKLTDGAVVNSKDLDGQVVMLQFTASWCGVCRREMPVIESEIWQVYKDKGLKLYGVDLDEPLEKVEALAKDTGVTYPLALDPGGKVFQLFAHEGSGVTRNVIIGRNGRIAFLTRLFDREEFDRMKQAIAAMLDNE